MPSPTWLDFARLSSAAYDANAQNVAGGWSRIWFGSITSGFQGARYRRTQFGAVQEVVAYTGTDQLMDALADVGFAGDSAVSRMVSLSPVLSVLVAAGRSGLTGQLEFAAEMLRQAQWFVRQARGELFITGHSLGGGLAQIMAAEFGGRAAPISAPTVSQVPGVLGRYERNRPTISCLRVDNDPINGTEALGRRLGSTTRLHTQRGIAAAHSIDGTVEDLGPTGTCTAVGSVQPF